MTRLSEALRRVRFDDQDPYTYTPQPSTEGIWPRFVSAESFVQKMLQGEHVSHVVYDRQLRWHDQDSGTADDRYRRFIGEDGRFTGTVQSSETVAVEQLFVIDQSTRGLRLTEQVTQYQHLEATFCSADGLEGAIKKDTDGSRQFTAFYLADLTGQPVLEQLAVNTVVYNASTLARIRDNVVVPGTTREIPLYYP